LRNPILWIVVVIILIILICGIIGVLLVRRAREASPSPSAAVATPSPSLAGSPSVSLPPGGSPGPTAAPTTAPTGPPTGPPTEPPTEAPTPAPTEAAFDVIEAAIIDPLANGQYTIACAEGTVSVGGTVRIVTNGQGGTVTLNWYWDGASSPLQIVNFAAGETEKTVTSPPATLVQESFDFTPHNVQVWVITPDETQSLGIVFEVRCTGL